MLFDLANALFARFALFVVIINMVEVKVFFLHCVNALKNRPEQSDSLK